MPLPLANASIALSPGLAGVVLSIAACLVVTAVFYSWRHKIVNLLNGNDTFRASFYILEPALAIMLSVIASMFDLYKPKTWERADEADLVATVLGASIACAYIGVKVMAAWAKEKEKARITELEGQISTHEAKAQQLLRQRNDRIRIANHVREIVSEKRERLIAASATDKLSLDEYLSALAPRDQLQFLLIMIHQFFSTDLEPGGKLRVGVYMREEPDSPKLFPAFGYDGKRLDCFRRDHSAYMRLDSVAGAQSAVVEAVWNDAPLMVIPSCEEAARSGSFRYFYPEQSTHLRSMVTYKHVWQRDGKPDALVVVGRFRPRPFLPTIRYAQPAGLFR